MAGGAKRESPGGVPKKNASCRVGSMRLASKSGNTLGSHAPQANTNAPARMAAPAVVRTAGSEPVPCGGATASRRNSTPWRTPSATTVATARRAISAPLSGSKVPHALGAKSIWGYRDFNSAGLSVSNCAPHRANVRRVCSVYGSPSAAVQRTPVWCHNGWPDSRQNACHNVSERMAERV